MAAVEIGGLAKSFAGLRSWTACRQISDAGLKVQYSIPVLFKELVENIAHSFMAKHDAIKISPRAPEIGYEEIHAAQLARCRHQYLPTSPSMVSIASERYWSATFRSICG